MYCHTPKMSSRTPVCMRTPGYCFRVTSDLSKYLLPLFPFLLSFIFHPLLEVVTKSPK
jgi:hypothetical protein